MQFASSGTLDEVQAYVASVIAQRGGTITAQSPALTSAVFTKRFAWLTFIGLMVLFGIGLIYLVYWYATKTQPLTVTYSVSGGVVTGYVQSKGKRADAAAKAIVSALT